MNREVHVRFWEGLAVRFRGATQLQDYVLAHMWFNLAAAQGEKVATDLRDSLAKKMTSAQIAEAQKLASEWKPRAK